MENPFSALRRWAGPRVERDVCALCSKPLFDEHPHLFEVNERRLVCACEACAILFAHREAGRFRGVPRDAHCLASLSMTDEAWAGLQLPIDLAFFVYCTPAKQMIAFYPSPAGATQANVDPEAWRRLVEDNPTLETLEPDVEALLINRVGSARDYFRLGIDQCFRLVGLIRTHWQGMSGGPEMWTAVRQFFDRLKPQIHVRSGALQ